MQVTSALFDARIREGGMRKTVVDIIYNNTTIAENIAVSSGSIRYDRKANIYGSGNIEIPDPSLIPNFLNNTLSPYGTEVSIRSGIVYPDLSEELIDMGVFILDTTSWEEAKGPIPSIDFFDRSMIFNRQEMAYIEDYAGQTAKNAITYLIRRNLPPPIADQVAITFDLALTDLVLPGGNLYSTATYSNYWELIQHLALAMGGDIYFTRDGSILVTPPPIMDMTTTSVDSVWEVDVGPRGVMANARRAITRKDTYNHVWVSGKANEGGVLPYYLALNDEPSSPTYYLGPFGTTGKRIEMPELTSSGDCQRIAQLKLKEYIRLSKTLEFTSLPNPALDTGDIVNLSYLSGETEIGLIESMNFPLGSGQFTGSCSASRI